jgi:hypothetical protein
MALGDGIRRKHRAGGPNRTGLIEGTRSLNCTSDTTLVSVSMTEQPVGAGPVKGRQQSLPSPVTKALRELCELSIIPKRLDR